MIILASQMEIIENTNYNNEIPIITEEDKNIYTNKKIVIDKDLNYLYKDFLLPSLQTLEKDIEAGLKNEKDNIISADNTRLIKTIKSFVLQADKYELYKNFTNWSGTKFFDIPSEPEWDKMVEAAKAAGGGGERDRVPVHRAV